MNGDRKWPLKKKKQKRDIERIKMKVASLTTFAAFLLLFYSLNGIFVAALFLRESAVLPS